MWTIGALSFSAPWALAGLAALPVIWWLLRLNPPQPRRIVFPPIVLLQRLTSQRESPARIPPWLLALRLMLAAAIIAGVAGPLINAETKLFGKGPLYVIVDDDWAASATWRTRQTALNDLIDHAERTNRNVVLVPTAPTPGGANAETPQTLPAEAARRAFQSLQPKPWATDRRGAINALLANPAIDRNTRGDVIWLSNGIEQSSRTGTAPGDRAVAMKPLLQRLKKLGHVTLITDTPGRLPVLLMPPEADGAALRISALRTSAAGGLGVQVRALAEDGEVLARLPLVFKDKAARTEAALDLPLELRNRLVRLEIAGQDSVGAVVLIDERWRRRPVGIVTAVGSKVDQPLLDAMHYLGTAMTPYTEVRRGGIGDLLKRNLAVLIMADPGRLPAAEVKAIEAWLDRGGVVVRFAGARLAREAGARDKLLPVQLRRGGRAIGGALSWRKPEGLAPFAKTSPFHGLSIPAEVKIRRQVLAQPSLDLAEKTWARLSDGTPLVTGARRGSGWLVLVHTTANAEWSDLSFSGLFVDMLRRLVQLSQGVAGSTAGPLTPLASLDGFGRLGEPPGGATAIDGKAFRKVRPAPAHPPGFYGTAQARRALNLSASMGAPVAIADVPENIDRRTYSRTSAVDLKPWLLALAALLFLIDLAASMWVRGLLTVRARRAAAAVAVMVLIPAAAHADDKAALANALQTRLAYVLSGDRRVDETSHAGLVGLNMILSRRTAAELGSPRGIDPAIDELAFFPLLYWPVVEGYQLSIGGAPKVVEYLRNGGTILFDTRDSGSAGGGGNAGEALAQLVRELDLPALVPVGQSHVLTRSFYLLKEFPGRWTGGALWVERAGERINDGVSPVIAGGHDWAAAWAIDDQQRPIFPVVPGGERQREMAYRFGVNLVMYTLTGNYKADQVHLPAIMRRLGQ